MGMLIIVRQHSNAIREQFMTQIHKIFGKFAFTLQCIVPWAFQSHHSKMIKNELYF